VLFRSAYYCAPEVWVNDYSPKVDVWAAGVVVYLALLGTFPFYDHDAGLLESLICNPDKSPTFEAVCQKECPDYQVSHGARQCLTALLDKDQDDRPSAAAALAFPWLKESSGSWSGAPHSSRSRSNPTLLGCSSNAESGLDCTVGTELCTADCEGIPIPIRVKAGRAAARPPVDPNKELSRTRALEAMKRRAAIGHGLNSSRSSFVGCLSPTSRSNSIAELLRSPTCQSRELSAEGTMLSMVEHDASPTDAAFSDSDGEGGLLAVCSCR